MPRRGASYFALPSSGGLERDPETIYSHRMPGAVDMELLEKAVLLSGEAFYTPNGLKVIVEITNHNTGHKIPTDFPGRHLILLVQVYDENGRPLHQETGPVLPVWTGEGKVEEGNFSGLAGEAYALILEEVWTGKSPSIAYWNPFEVLSDNRIEVDEVKKSEYAFSGSVSGEVTISIQLILRRNFKDVMDWKQWDSPDIVIEDLEITLND